MLDYNIPRFCVDRYPYLVTTFKHYSIKKLVEMAKEQNIDCDALFQGEGKIFVMNCYNIL